MAAIGRTAGASNAPQSIKPAVQKSTTKQQDDANGTTTTVQSEKVCFLFQALPQAMQVWTQVWYYAQPAATPAPTTEARQQRRRAMTDHCKPMNRLIDDTNERKSKKREKPNAG